VACVGTQVFHNVASLFAFAAIHGVNSIVLKGRPVEFDYSPINNSRSYRTTCPWVNDYTTAILV